MSSTKIRSTVAVLAAAVTVMTAGLSAPAADASIGSVSAHLSVSRNFQRYSVTVTGVVSMTQAEAQDLINRGHGVVWRLWGEDQFSDDFLFGPDPASVASSAGALGLTSTAQGLAFKGSRVTTGGVLDEDDSFFDDHDELYAGVRLVTSLRAGAPTVRSGESNRVGGYF